MIFAKKILVQVQVLVMDQVVLDQVLVLTRTRFKPWSLTRPWTRGLDQVKRTDGAGGEPGEPTGR